MEAIKTFYRRTRSCLRVDGKLSQRFDIRVEVKQGCVMSPWLFNVYLDRCMREMKARVGEYRSET